MSRRTQQTTRVLHLSGHRIIQVKGPGYDIQLGMEPGESMRDALLRHYADLDTRAERLVSRRNRVSSALAKAL